MKIMEIPTIAIKSRSCGMGRRSRRASKPEPRMKVGAAAIAIAPYI